MSATTESPSPDFLATLAAFGWSLSRSDLEDAFRALVGWPDEAAIPESTADMRRHLLEGVCHALIRLENGRGMPEATFRRVVEAAEDIDGPSYADGARAVLRTPAFFDALKRRVA